MRDALAFLTVVPLRGGRPPGRAALVLFPVAGVLVGAVWTGAGWAGARWWSPQVAGALVLAADLLVTGGLHLDGLADTADGLAARRRGGALEEAMRDPRVGAVGAAALAVVLLVRFALLAAVLSQPAGWLRAAAAPVAGRAALVWALGAMRAGGGSLAGASRPAGGPVASAPRPARSLASAPHAAATLPVRGAAGALAVLLVIPVAWVRGVIGVVAALGAANLAGRWWARRGGPLSGDAAGAAGVLAETVALAVLAAT